MKSFSAFLDEAGRCWPGHRPVPGKKPYSPGSCVKEEVELDKSVPSEDDLAKKYKMSISDIQDLVAHGTKVEMEHTDEKHVARKIALKHIGEKSDYYKKLKKFVEEREGDAGGADNPVFTKPKMMKVKKENYEADDGPLTDEQLEQLEEVAAWQRKEGKSESGGLNRKGIESYRRENPGSKLSMAVTTKPSKLKPGSKAANRRKSFCARMGGMKRRLTSAKTARDPDSRINKALRKWNC
jgi:hypothetical protein